MYLLKPGALLGLTALAAALPSPEVPGGNSSVSVPPSSGFEVVIVYAQPEEGCRARACSSEQPFSSGQTLSSSAGISPPASPQATASASSPGVVVSESGYQLMPNVHWSVDISSPTNVIPISVGNGHPLYYGSSDSSQAGYYGMLTYYFTSPSVNLDHCGGILDITFTASGGTITFSSTEFYNNAVNSWTDDLILVAFNEACEANAEGNRCYFSVTAIDFKDGLVVEVVGSFCDPQTAISKGETEWGWYYPRSGTHGTGGGSSVNWGSGAGGSSGSSGPGSGTSGGTATTTSSSPSSSATGGSSGSGTDADNFGDTDSCVPPADTKYGLPTACLGALFDEDLDNSLGYIESLNSTFMDFINDVAPDDEDDSAPTAAEDGDDGDDDFGSAIDLDLDSAKLRRRHRFRRRELTRRWSLSGLVHAVTHPIETAKNLYQAAKQATSLSGSFNKDMSFKLPDPNNASNNKLKDPSTKQITSPWGDSILIKAFGNQQKADSGKDGLTGYMNVFCVGCGVSGDINVAGKAAWSPLGGFTQGQVEMHANMQFVLKLGIDAQLNYKQEFSNQLLEIPLPSIKFEIVTIGPWIDVGTHITLDAEAQGRLLVGAEMGLQNAHALVDFVTPSNSQKDGWQPYFKPVFQADGQIMLSATLGLPVGLKCGVSVAGFSKSIGLIDEPSITGTAQVAASVGLTSSGGFAAGFKETNGCTGIATQISWRNKLFVDVAGFTQIPLFDTNDKPLAQNCIALPALPASSSSSTSLPPPSSTADSGASSTASDSGATPTPSDTASSAPSDAASTAASDAASATPSGDASSATPTDDAATSTSSPEATETPIADRDLHSRDNANTTVTDLTSSVSSNATTLTYTSSSLPNDPYNGTDGYEYNLLTVADGSVIFITCGNGGMYMVDPNGPDNPACTSMWATYGGALVGDGANRVMHYYSNTMDVVGVSRLRVSDEESMPETGILIAWAMLGDDDYFLAVDPDGNVFYPIMCSYSDGNAAKMFLAADPDAGVTMLQSPDVEYSITGGAVASCFPVPMLLGTFDSGDDYTGYDNSTSSDTLSLDDGDAE